MGKEGSGVNDEERPPCLRRMAEERFRQTSQSKKTYGQQPLAARECAKFLFERGAPREVEEDGQIRKHQRITSVFCASEHLVKSRRGMALYLVGWMSVSLRGDRKLRSVSRRFRLILLI